MADPTLPRRSWEGGEREIVLDKNGVSRAVYRNPYSAQEDHQRYEREKTADEMRTTEGNQDSPIPQNQVISTNPASAPPMQAPPKQEPTAQTEQPPSWLQAMQQRYASELPLHLSLDKNSPEVTPDMLFPSDEQLAAMDEETREGLGRVFLTLAIRYYGDESLKNAVLYGTAIRGFIPAEMVAEFKRITGRR